MSGLDLMMLRGRYDHDIGPSCLASQNTRMNVLKDKAGAGMGAQALRRENVAARIRLADRDILGGYDGGWASPQPPADAELDAGAKT